MHKDQQHDTPAAARGTSNAAPRAAAGYPVGRGYGHDLMRGGEVFGGYGYSERPEYERTRGETAKGGGSS